MIQKVYLADDDLEDQELFKNALEQLPFHPELFLFQDGLELMDDLFSKKPLPDAIFLDLYMPIMNGFDCLHDIRNFRQFSAIDIIVYSTTYVRREVRQLKKDGANQFMQKPNSFDQLIHVLSKSLEQVEKNLKQKSQQKSFIEFI